MLENPIKSAVEAALARPVAEHVETWPTDLKSGYALLAEIKAQEPEDADAAEAKEARMKSLMIHLNKLGQGLPTIYTKAADQVQGHLVNVRPLARLTRLVAQNPALAAWLSGHGIQLATK